MPNRERVSSFFVMNAHSRSPDVVCSILISVPHCIYAWLKINMRRGESKQFANSFAMEC